MVPSCEWEERRALTCVVCSASAASSFHAGVFACRLRSVPSPEQGTCGGTQRCPSVPASAHRWQSVAIGAHRCPSHVAEDPIEADGRKVKPTRIGARDEQ